MLNHWLDDAVDGNGRVVFLSGEAGVGKTALINRFCELSRSRARLLRGTCDALSTPRVLGPLLDIAAAIGGPLDRLINEGGSRDQLFRAVMAELTTGLTPTITIIDDAQWADQATMDLIRFLGRRFESTRALLLVIYRDDEAGPAHPLRMMLGDLATAQAVRRLALQPLSVAGVQTMIDRAPGASAVGAESLHHKTGGNPFFVSEILAVPALEEIPATVRDAVLARAARLPAVGREALDVASVLCSPFPISLFHDVVDLPGDALESPTALGMLIPAGESSLVFRHDLARTAIYEAISPGRRHLMHRRILAAMLEHPAYATDWSMLACHAESAGEAGVVLDVAPLAARQAAALQAHRESAEQYDRALKFSGGLAPGERAELLEAHAYECYLIGAFDAAIYRQRDALRIWEELNDLRRVGDAWRKLSRFCWFTGLNGEAEQAAELALRTLEALPPGRELAMALSNRSQLYMLADDNEDAIAWGLRALPLAEAFADVEIETHALTNIGNARMRLGDPRGRGDLERSLELARRANLGEHAARAFTNLACNALHSRDLDLADRYFDEGLVFTAEHDLDSWRRDLLAWRGYLRLLQGRWDDADADAAAVLDAPNLPLVSRIPALNVAGLVRARQGRAGGRALLDEALTLAEMTGEIQRLRPVRIARAELAWLSGDLTCAVAEVEAVLAETLRRGSAWEIGETLVWSARIGSEVRYPEAERLAVPGPLLAELRGDRVVASDEWTRLGCPYDAALALLGGDEQTIREAHDRFGMLAARPAEALAAQRLRQLGARGIPRGPRPATRANPANLTARELEIVPLLICGCQNSEIADQLFLSVKTVGHHVGRILTKLGVRRRGEVAAAVDRFGIEPPADQRRELVSPK